MSWLNGFRNCRIGAFWRGTLPLSLAIPVALALAFGGMGYLFGGIANMALCMENCLSMKNFDVSVATFLTLIPGLTLPFIFTPIYEAFSRNRWLKAEWGEMRKNGLNLNSVQEFLSNEKVEEQIQKKSTNSSGLVKILRKKSKKLLQKENKSTKKP